MTLLPMELPSETCRECPYLEWCERFDTAPCPPDLPMVCRNCGERDTCNRRWIELCEEAQEAREAHQEWLAVRQEALGR